MVGRRYFFHAEDSMSEQAKPQDVSSIIQNLISYIEKHAPAPEIGILSKIAVQYFDKVALEDLQSRSPENLYAILYSHWQLLSQRKKDELKVRIINPEPKMGIAHSHRYTLVEVITDDMPFLVDSLRMEIAKEGYNVHFMIHLGGMKFKRDEQMRVVDILPLNSAIADNVYSEAPIYIEIDRINDSFEIEKLRMNLVRVLGEVRVCFEDWASMRSRLHEAMVELDGVSLPISEEEIIEAKDFLRWLENDHFTFLGCRDYVIVGEGEKRALELVQGTGLGILRDESHSHSLRPLASLPAAAREVALSNHLLLISKTNSKSSVHRPAYTDYIGVKRFNKKGELIGERRFIGLYTSVAYHSNPKDIPYLRRQVKMVLERSGLLPQSHAGKTLANILETLPRDDLFQADVDQLTEISMGILQLQERQRIRLFVRWDVYRRFASCLVYVPREWFNTELRHAMQAVIGDTFHATEIDFTVTFSESVLARIHFLVRTDPKTAPDVDFKRLEARLVEIGRTWRDELQACLCAEFGEEKAAQLLAKYAKAFPASYREDFTARNAVFDIEEIEKISSKDLLGMCFYRPTNDASGLIQLKLFHFKETIPLSDALPMLENMGLRIISERPYEIRPHNSDPIWINDFGMMHPAGLGLDVVKLKPAFQEAFLKIWEGKLENDGFNRLVLSASLNWREVSIIRAIAKYLRQAGFTFSQAYIEQTMANHPEAVRVLVELFKLRFDPKLQQDNESAIKQHEADLLAILDKVSNLDEDRIIRRYHAILMAMLRTNYYQMDKEGRPKSYLSFKLNSSLVPELPLPHPLYEIFVYSSRFEGIHLRSAKVARGGIRWSDRREDFRTEVLGLMKAQKVKNAVIVPSGAKGGFVPKCIPHGASREQVQAEGVACYQTYIRGLLDITDNLVNSQIQPPPDVVRYDLDDPYLVVAADKGTATFSDIANEISLSYDFWLGDAFASGGKTGYDHKKMGITARGAWESAKRHFRGLGKDIQTSDFTVVGIGDMSGDVFGNGMLLSEHIKLVAAFNHMHIFIDPNPNAAISFQERKRLFELPRSSWSDYNPELISPGGGIFARSAKSIPLSKEIQNLLDFPVASATPNELIVKILEAKVDMLFNGGIGTYVKAPQETNNDVGDHANDAIRINGQQLRSRVVVEGGNLGLTQLGRVNYALHDGILYTDFIDNSAGVDCSDHEVNIKILLNYVIRKGGLTEEARNTLLASMTDDVADLVLRDNYMQTQAISLEETHALKDMALYGRYMDDLAKTGKLDRVVEFLPSPDQMKARKLENKSLTTPELAVLLAYSKMILKEEILKTDILEDPYFSDVLTTAFPACLSEHYREAMEHHGLRREIIATQVSNAIVNEMGVTFVYRLQDETGATIPALVRAFAVARQVFDLPGLWKQVESLDYKIPAQTQLHMMYELSRLVRRASRWFLRHRRAGLNIDEAVAMFSEKAKAIRDNLASLMVGEDLEVYQLLIDQYREQGVEEALAKTVAASRFVLSALDIIEVTDGFDPLVVARMYYQLGHALNLGWFHEQVNNFPVETHWDALAREAIRDELDAQQRDLCMGVMNTASTAKSLDEQIEAWLNQHAVLVARWQSTLTDMRMMPSINYVVLSVAVRELSDLTQTTSQAAIMSQ